MTVVCDLCFSVFQIAQSESVQYLARGSQSLREPLTLALKSRDMVCTFTVSTDPLSQCPVPLYSLSQNVAAMAAMKIVESCGTSDAQSTALHLAVYQVVIAAGDNVRAPGTICEI